jgi:beta-lactamase superfamily II metal-dependent hydrolase
LCVVDVGQGLSQIGISNGVAVVWDIGPPEGFDEWTRCYIQSGKPSISSIVVSHSDRDHAGALSLIDQRIDWSGDLIVNRYEDTTALKALFTEWKKPVNIRLTGQGDTLMLGQDIKISCLWPPENMPSMDITTDKNKYSLSFKIQHGYCSMLITSDLDSMGLETISDLYNTSLESDVLIVPHHGSKQSYNYSFFSKVIPEYAVISYGKNTFGHPSPDIIALLFSLDCNVLFTAVSGTCYFTSNSFYWNTY